MKQPIRVAVTGAAGQIGYALLFRIASGEMLGKDQPVILQMLELPLDKAQAALKGVMMELEDCAFPLLAGMVGTDDPEVAFKDADIALLPVEPGQRFLVCSDGLTGELRDEEIADLLARTPGAEAAAEVLVRTAAARGASDNVTAVVVEVHPVDGSAG